MSRCRHANAGLSLVEVLVALAVLGVIAAALMALQVSSLRATRSAHQVREAAAAADYQLGLARISPTVAGCTELESWPSVVGCELTSSCLTASCDLRTITVRVESVSGRVSEFTTAALHSLELAPVRPGGSAEGEIGTPLGGTRDAHASGAPTGGLR